MSLLYIGSCQCNQVELQLTLPKPLQEYEPRACDCDFCAQRDVLYVSDPLSRLNIVSTINLFHSKQGSEQAQFLSCVNCEQLVAVVTEINGELRGAINAECLDDSSLLAKPVSVNPKSLNPTQKRERWAKSWSKVSLSEPD